MRHILKYNYFFDWRMFYTEKSHIPHGSRQNEMPSLKPALFSPSIPKALLLFVA